MDKKNIANLQERLSNQNRLLAQHQELLKKKHELAGKRM
jgi:hypothetical protein